MKVSPSTGLGPRLGFVLLILSHATAAESLEHVTWHRSPIAVELAVGEERRVTFPEPVRVGIPTALQTQLRTQSVDGTVYWLAGAPFPSTRVQVQGMPSGRVYLLNVGAQVTEQTFAALAIHRGDEQEPDAQASESSKDLAQPNQSSGPPSYVTLTRFAAQQLYAPARIAAAAAQQQPTVGRIAIARSAVPLVRGGGIAATPVATWSRDGLFVTAVRLVNQRDSAVELDPRDLRGTWLTAAFHHETLWPSGDDADTTAVYLISAQPFHAALGQRR